MSVVEHNLGGMFPLTTVANTHHIVEVIYSRSNVVCASF